MGARQYDPLSGRFLSVDPLYESFPDKTPYHYCNNNPISFKDPSGLSPEGEKGKEDEVQVVYYLDFSWCYEMMEKTQRRMEEARIAREAFLMEFETRFLLCSIRQEFNDFFSESSQSGGGGGGGRIRLCPYGTDAERKVLADALGEITNTDIIYDENGVITSIEMRSSPPRHQNQVWAAKRLAGFMNLVKDSGKDFDIFFADHDQCKYSSCFYYETDTQYPFGNDPSGDGTLENISIVIDRGYHITHEYTEYYDYREWASILPFNIGPSFWVGIYEDGAHTIYSILGHEMFGHAYQFYELGSVGFGALTRNQEEFYAVINENLIHEIFNEPFRFRYNENKAKYPPFIFPFPFQRMNKPFD